MAAPKTEQEKIRDEALRRMLNTPHKPHMKTKKKAARKKARRPRGKEKQ